MVKTRVGYYDIAKLVAISAVIYGHCIQHYLDQNPLLNPVYLLIYSFHMPLFMIISGYFSCNSLKLNFLPFVKKKSIQLLVPYFSWQLISIIVKFFLDDINIESIIRYDFWFLVSLYICSILAWFLCRIKQPYQILFLVFSLIITHVGLFRLKDMYPCFLMGLLMNKQGDWINRYKRPLTIVSLLLSIALLSFTLNEHYFEVGFTPNGLLKQLNIIVVGVLLSFLVIRICELFENKAPSLLLRLGQYTLGIYLIQSLIFTCTKDYVSFTSLQPLFVHLFIFPLVVLVIIAISMFFISIINKSEILSLFLLGKRK